MNGINRVEAIIERIKALENLKSSTDVAELLKIDRQNLYTAKRRNSYSSIAEEVATYASERKQSLDYIVNGIEPEDLIEYDELYNEIDDALLAECINAVRDEVGEDMSTEQISSLAAVVYENAVKIKQSRERIEKIKATLKKMLRAMGIVSK